MKKASVESNEKFSSILVPAHVSSISCLIFQKEVCPFIERWREAAAASMITDIVDFEILHEISNSRCSFSKKPMVIWLSELL